MDTEPPIPPIFLIMEIGDRQRHWPGIDQSKLEALTRRTLTREGVEAAEISIILVDDATIRDINRRHLAHDWPTDVITFPLSQPGETPLSGELILSTETALTSARIAGADPWNELSLYLVHGLLHLIGFDDQTLEDAETMRHREAFHLAAEGLANPFDRVEPMAVASDREAQPCPV